MTVYRDAHPIRHYNGEWPMFVDPAVPVPSELKAAA